jgi:hypothetical protein
MSQEVRTAFVTNEAELAYNKRGLDKGLAMGDINTGTIIDFVGMSFVPV